MVCPRDIFKPALDYNAASIFLVHNHPSGDPEPSDQDMLLTRELEICGMFMGIDIICSSDNSIQDYVEKVRIATVLGYLSLFFHFSYSFALTIRVWKRSPNSSKRE
jgi:hypothetical protein